MSLVSLFSKPRSNAFLRALRPTLVRGLAASALGLGLLGSASVHAQTPLLVGYQGALFDAQGQPAQGTADVEVAIWDAQTGGARLYAESHIDVPLVDGTFDLQIGSGSSPAGTFDEQTFAGAQAWLELTVDGEVLDPRQRLVAVPYALRAKVAESLDGAIGSAPFADQAGHAATADRVLSAGTPGADQDLLGYGLDASGATVLDGGRVQFRNHYFPSGGGDAIVFDKTDANDADPDGGFVFANTGADGIEEPAMVIRGDGRVGIGTVAPAAPLHVDGGALIRVDGAGEKALVTGDSNRALMFVDQLGTGEAFEARGSGSGTARATIRGENLNPANGVAGYFTSQGWGPAAYIHNTGVGPALYVDNGGQGDMIAAFDPTLTGEASKRFWVDDQGVTHVRTLKIHGGADLSEPFDVSTSTDAPIEPGTVLAIDPEAPGKLAVSRGAYARTVAGVVAGAGGIEPGLLLHQQGVEGADGEHPVAITGRVYVKADTSNGAIRPGDLLTTSDRPGHAMRVSDWQRSQGAVLGKAMSRLDAGEGLVLVLIGLQ